MSLKERRHPVYLSLAIFLLIPGICNCQSGRLPIRKNQTEKNNTIPDYSERISLIRIPGQYNTIEEAVRKARRGDTLIISPGTYIEKKIVINKPLTISSEWMFSGKQDDVEKTVIDADGSILFSVTAENVAICGLKIINGDHPVSNSARVTIMNNHFDGNRDAISMEGGSGGYIAYNLIENDRDDGIDSDIGDDEIKVVGSNLIIEHNTILNSQDDGIEIRLFKRPFQNIEYEIRHNIIKNCRNAGIQIISYNINTGKVFIIHHNIFSGCKTALGCMENAKTVEDLLGASQMDEPVFLYNNTIIRNEMGATGGNQVIALNNIVSENRLGGFKHFGENSIVANNILFNNGANDLTEVAGNVELKSNLFSADPQIDNKSFVPGVKKSLIKKQMKKTGGIVTYAAKKYPGRLSELSVFMGAVKF